MKFLLTCFFIIFSIFSSTSQEISSYKRILKLMGCRFEITATATNKMIAENAVIAGIQEITRIEQLISEWKYDSQTSQINKFAGIKPIKVDKELYDLIYRSLKISTLTDGAFDISFASMDKIWQFDKAEHIIPDSVIVKVASSKINFRNIILNSEYCTVFLKEKGMKIGFGAIGKGYSANKAKQLMENIPGVKGGVVNASGDLLAWGESTHPEGWSIQIANPKDIKKSLGWIKLNNMSIVTSGDYEKYFTSGGIRFAHIINPLTGYPITDIKSVTIISPDAEFSDALATSVCVMGVEKGIDLVNKLNAVECLIIDHENNIFTSNHLQLNYYK